MNMQKSIKILGINIQSYTWPEIAEKLDELLKIGRKFQVVTVNTEFISTAQNSPVVTEMINSSKIRVADGVGLLIAAKYLSIPKTKNKYTRWIHKAIILKICILAAIFYPKYLKTALPERISGVDLSHEIVKIAIKNKLKIFLLGAQTGVAEKVALKLQTDNFDLRISGVYAGSPKVDDEQKIIDLINKHRTDILFVAYNFPQQDLWIKRNLKKLNVKMAIGLGGTFNYLSGEKKRAPEWMQTHGLEWLYRLVTEPAKRFKRQLSLPRFLYLLYKSN